jgi:hypothetical protein
MYTDGSMYVHTCIFSNNLNIEGVKSSSVVVIE